MGDWGFLSTLPTLRNVSLRMAIVVIVLQLHARAKMTTTQIRKNGVTDEPLFPPQQTTLSWFCFSKVEAS